MVRPAQAGDAQSIAEIYNYYIRNTSITFEEQDVTAVEMAQRIKETTAEELPYLVLEEDGVLRGYAYASKWKGRCAYRYSVEITVYLSPDAGGHGYGSLLYTQLFSELKTLGYHVAMAGISLPNEASIALHEKFGMRKVAHFEEVGFKFDQWVDVAYWQCNID